MKHRLEAEATKVHLKTASSELKKVEASKMDPDQHLERIETGHEFVDALVARCKKENQIQADRMRANVKNEVQGENVYFDKAGHVGNGPR